MRSRLWALAVSAALPLAVPAVAGAATIHVEPDHLRFVDDDAAHRLRVEQPGGQVRFRYASLDATPISAPPPCSQTEPTGSAACPVRDLAVVQMRGGNDGVAPGAATPLVSLFVERGDGQDELTGGAGNDTLVRGPLVSLLLSL